MYVRDDRVYNTYGEYLRGKNIRIDTGVNGRNAWDSEIEAYKDARRQGIQPAGTKMKQIREAVELSDMAGRAYDAGTGSFFN